MHAAVLLALLVPAHAQVLYKCQDAQQRITYSNVRCEEQGLKKLGEVQERVTVLPRPAARKAEEKPKADDQDARPAATIKPVNPLLESLK
ncbi:MAG TPA: DUF4124 domain-containing protein [Burkholderiales bacterium]|nr:DUF4124 domain-containing protein [Burkholderiales bacterium]